MDMTEVRNNVFYSEEVYYDLDDRNYLVLDSGDEDEGADAGEDADA